MVLALRYPASHRLANREASYYLAFDVLQLAALLYLTGGITNPFALMFVAPVVIAAATLNLGNTLILAGIAFASVSLIGIFHRPLPWPAGEALVLPQLYQAGIWAALVIGIGFTSVYAWRIASESARMSAGLAATQLALAREHRLASLGALATAAAHELGTPLGTIAVVARELERALPENSAESRGCAAAARAGRTLPRHHRPPRQSGRSHAGPGGAAAAGRLAGRYRGPASRRGSGHHRRRAPHGDADDPAPQVWRVPELLHGLGNIIENAADFAKTRSRGCRRSGMPAALNVVIEDDGPGFAPEIFERIGEPYVTSRPGHHAPGETDIGPGALGEHEGMGLGFFIAKVLLEQTGGTVKAVNPPGGGARVSVTLGQGRDRRAGAAGPN